MRISDWSSDVCSSDLEGYRLEGTNAMAEISRDPADLVRQTMSEHHFPDGFALFCGTLFAPTQDRDQPGKGFTHEVGDRVSISAPRLGRLTNGVTPAHDAPPWRIGIAAFLPKRPEERRRRRDCGGTVITARCRH